MCTYYRHMSALGRGVVEAVLTALGVAPDLPLVRELFDHVPLPVGEWCVGAYYTSGSVWMRGACLSRALHLRLPASDPPPMHTHPSPVFVGASPPVPLGTGHMQTSSASSTLPWAPTLMMTASPSRARSTWILGPSPVGPLPPVFFMLQCCGVGLPCGPGVLRGAWRPP